MTNLDNAQSGAVELVRRPHDVTEAWLTAVMRHAGVIDDGAAVVAFEVSQVGTGQMGETVRFELEYDGIPGPGSVVGKFASADERSRSTGLALRAYEVEVRFYQHVASRVRLRVPRCLFAEVDPTTGWFTLLMEDLAPADQGDQIAGCAKDVATAAIEALAGLHAPCWEAGDLAALGWLNRRSPEGVDLTGQLLVSALPGFLERYGDRIQPEHVRLCERFIPRTGDWLAGERGPRTVTHGDYRLDNMLFRPGDVEPFVVDWQTVGWGMGTGDAAYFLGGSLVTEDRRASEIELLHVYHDRLLASGVENYSWPTCVDDYRRMSFGGLAMAVGASMLVERTERGDEMFATFARRHAQQILDLDAEDTLGP